MIHSKFVGENILLKLSFLVLNLLLFPNFSQAQESKIEIKPFLIELGTGYPITLSGKPQFLDSYINLGYQRELNQKMFAGVLLSSQHRQGWRADFVISPKLRLGRSI